MESSLSHALSTTANPASSHLASKTRFPEDGGHSLAEMARRDLDAALQLLADRAQYITGATGAAIALRRTGKNDMLCRASTGSNAPELGALLSTEFGLSGESVRTRQPLRCDDAERDVRVNREVCRQLGIASVVVMPVVNDDGVLGVFELFSGRVNAFGERDLSAVQRLSEMVETAVRLAEAAEKLPERLKANELSAPSVGTSDAEEDRVLEGPELVPGDLRAAEELNLDDLVLDEIFVKEPEPVLGVAVKENVQNIVLDSGAVEAVVERVEAAAQKPVKVETPILPPAVDVRAPVTAGTVAAAPVESKAVVAENVAVAPVEPKPPVAENVIPAAQTDSLTAQALPAASADTVPPKKPLFWSAEVNSAADAEKLGEADRSHVPPVLRGLRKCDACGFPVSAGRALCVECEEKKWRGQLRVPQGAGPRQAAIPPAAAPVAVAPAVVPKEARAFAAAAPASVATPMTRTVPAAAVASGAGGAASAAAKKSSARTAQEPSAARGGTPPTQPTPLKPAEEALATRDFVFSAGMGTSQSWFSANKYVIGIVLLVAAVAVTAVFLLR